MGSTINWATFDWSTITRYEDVPTTARRMAFGDEGFNRSVVPNNVRIRLYDEWQNRPTTGKWDDDFPMELFPDEPLPPPSPPMDIPIGSEDTIMKVPINQGDEMTEFDNETKVGRFYKSNTYALLNGKNPFTREQIDKSTVRKYSANLVDASETTGTGRKTKSKRTRRVRKNKSKKMRKSRKRIVRK